MLSKKINILRLLIGLNGVIFLLPFFNTCSNTPLRNEHKKIMHAINSNNEYAKDYKEELLKNEISRFENGVKSNDKYERNAYQYSLLIFGAYDGKGFNIEPVFYFGLAYTFIVLLTLIQLYCSIKNKLKGIKITTLVNIALLLMSLLIAYLNDFFNYLDQIKIGFYMYLVNNILVLYFKYKFTKEESVIIKNLIIK